MNLEEMINAAKANRPIVIPMAIEASNLSEALQVLTYIEQIANDANRAVVEQSQRALDVLYLVIKKKPWPSIGQDEITGIAGSITVVHKMTIPCVWWPNATHDIFSVCGIPLILTPIDDRGDRPTEWDALIRALHTRNVRLGYSPPHPEEVRADQPVQISTTDPIKGRIRDGPRLMQKSPEQFRLPTSGPAQQALAIIGIANFTEIPGADSISSQTEKAQVRIDCDPAIGFTTQKALQTLAKCGPSAVQTYLALAGVWLEQCKGKSYETYLTASVTDILKFMGRQSSRPSSKGTGGGGFPNDEIVPRGSDVYLLSRTRVQNAVLKEVKRGSRRVTQRTIEIENLVTVQKLIAQDTLGSDGARVCPSYIEFRYHLGETMYNVLAGESPQYAEISTKILRYHPQRDKYLILLGVALAYLERVNRHRRLKELSIEIPSLLKLAAIDIPETHIDQFFKTVKRSIKKLNDDGVVEGAKIDTPGNLKDYTAREELAVSTLSFQIRPLSIPAATPEQP